MAKKSRPVFSRGRTLSRHRLQPERQRRSAHLPFRVLEPASSVLQLRNTIFPVAGSLPGVLRKGTVDAIGLIAPAGVAIHLTLTMLAPRPGTALVLRSLAGTIIGLCFMISAAIGRPVIVHMARRFVTARRAWEKRERGRTIGATRSLRGH